MKMILISSLILSSVPALAAKIKDAKCSDMAAVNESMAPQYLAVIDGYDKAGKKVSEEVSLD